MSAPEKPDIAKLEAQVDADLKNPLFGVRPDELTAFCGEKIWKIRREGATKQVRDEIMRITDEFSVEFKKLEKADPTGNRLGKAHLSEATTKMILDLGLEDFDYDAAANDPDIGPVILLNLARELQIFLVDNGGPTGTKYLQTLQRLDMLTRLRTVETASGSGGSSAAPSTASAQ